MRPGPYRSAIWASQPTFVAGHRVGGVRAAGHDQLGSERAKPLDLLHVLDGLAGVDSAQLRPIQQPIDSCLGARPPAGTHPYGPEDPAQARAKVRGGGNAPSSP